MDIVPAAASTAHRDGTGTARPLRHISSLPGTGPVPRITSPVRDVNALSEYTATGLPWSSVPQRMTARTARALWALVAVAAVVAAVLAVVAAHPGSCRGAPCDVATFGGHPVLTLGLVLGGVAALLVLAAFTRGFRQASAGQLGTVAAAAVWTVVSTAGAVLVLLAAGLLAAVVLIVVLSFADRS